MTRIVEHQRARLDALLARADALKRKCQTGYACGSTCINVKKECRSEGGAAVSKERIKRLEQLAKGEIKPRGIGTPKPEEAAALAGALRTARTSKAGELRDQRKAAREAKEQAAATKQAATTRAAKATANPRAEADTVESSGDYDFARKSEVQNAGEDIALSARHRRNAFRTIEEAEASGQVEKILTRDNLFKNFPTDLVSGIDEHNALSRLEAHYALRAFPSLAAKDVDKYVAAAKRRKDQRDADPSRQFTPEEAVDAKTVRKQYFDTFQELRQMVESNKDLPPGELRRKMTARISEMIGTLRKQSGEGYGRTYRDPFNPVANSLISMHDRLRKTGKTSLYGQMNEFAKALKATGDMDQGAETAMKRAAEAAAKVIEGASLDKAFGREGNGKWRFTSAERYVGAVRRSGGRSVGGTPEQATDAIVKGLGFRGLQYGNSVTDDERRHHVQKAAEALVDLADAIGLPDSAIGLNGTLALAIGARGRGGAVAHYEPDLKVINLTRKNGVGSLAHEWAHALDNYAAGGQSFLSDYVGSPEQRSKMLSVVNSWSESAYTQSCYAALREIRQNGGMVNEKYWLSHVEMFARSFEGYVALKQLKAGKANTYQTREFTERGAKKAGQLPFVGEGLWPTEEQARKMEPMFDALIAQLRQDKFPGPTNRTDSRDERIWRFMHAIAGARR